MPGHTDSMKCIAVMNSHKFVVTGACDKTVRFWDFEGEKEAWVWFGHADFVISLGIIPTINMWFPAPWIGAPMYGLLDFRYNHQSP